MLQQTPSLQRVARPVPPPRNLASEDGPLAEGREFVWSDADFSRIKALIYKKAGISLHDGKHAMVYSGGSRGLRETVHDSFKTYLDWL
jgi:chemotaxis protein methyltransferase CheR